MLRLVARESHLFMKINMKKILKYILILTLLVGPMTAHAQVSSNFWKLVGGILQPIISIWPVSFQYSSSTVYASFKTASSTFYQGAGLTSCNGATNALTWSGGFFGCNTITGSGGSFSFSPDTNFGVQVYSTSTPTLWFKSGLYASSTSHFVYASSTALSVSGNLYFPLTKGYFLVGDDAGLSQATSSIFVSSVGYVGIGTTGPGVKLDVRGTRYAAGVGSYQGVTGLYSTDALGAGVGAGLMLGGTYTGSTVTEFAQIAGVKENATDNNTAGGMALSTRSAAGAMGEKVRIDSSGNVGIGQTAPGSLLSVAGGISAGSYSATAAPSNGMIISGNVGIGTTTPNNALQVVGSGIALGNPSAGTYHGNSFLYFDDRYPSLQFKTGVTVRGQFISDVNTGDMYVDFSNIGDLHFRNQINTGEMVTFKQSGNVGIGTTSPSDILTINGNGRIENQGQLKFSELRANGNQMATISATSSMASDYNITLPTACSTGQVWADNGVGNLYCTSLGTGTVTSVDMTVPTGLTISGNPITGAGTLALSLTAGYSIPTTVKQTSWDNKWDLASSTIGNAYLTNSTISGVSLGSNLAALTNDTTLNGSTYNGSGAISDWGLNLANANSWTALQTFANASTTILSASYASSTKYYGANLATCQSGNFLTWLSGAFGCASDQTGSAGVMTSQLAAASQVSTSTTITSGKKYFFATSFSTGDTVALGLYIYQDGTKNATTTLQGLVNCNMGGVTNENCPITLMGTFTATTTETVHIFAGTDSNTIYTVPASYNANFIVIEF